MADTGKLILFFYVYLFLPPFILIPSPGRFQLKSIHCWDVSFPLRCGCWVWFDCGLCLARVGRAAGQKSCVCCWVCVHMSLQRYRIGVTYLLCCGLSLSSTETAKLSVHATGACPPPLGPAHPPGLWWTCLAVLLSQHGVLLPLYFPCRLELEVCVRADLIWRLRITANGFLLVQKHLEKSGMW